MSRSLLVLVTALLCMHVASTDTTPVETSTQESLHPVYRGVSTLRTPVYVPHATFLDSDGYPDVSPSIPYSDGAVGSYASGLWSSPRDVIRFVLLIFSNIGQVLLNGLGLFFIGGIFTTIVCTLIPYCTISFHDWSQAETVRQFITPDRISKAAAIVQDAVDKYDRLQRSVNNY